MKKSKRLRLDSLVLSKEGLPVCPTAASRHSWALGKAAQHPSLPTHQGPEAHTSWAREGWLTHPQSLELHLDSCPKMHDLQLHAQSCMTRSTQHWQDIDLTITWYISKSVFILKGALTVLLLVFLWTLKWNVRSIMRLICSPPNRKP